MERWTQEEYREYLRTGKEPQAGAAIPGAKPEQDRRDALVQAPACPQFHPKVRIIVTVWRARGGWDADNVETKACVDSLVATGIIQGDTIKHVQSVTKQGFKCKHKHEERTEIEVIQL